MLLRPLAILLALSLLFVAAPPAAAQHGAGVTPVLERARAAMGGTRAWNALRGFHEAGTDDGRPYQHWVDTLRWGERIETGAGAGKVVQGYNGYGLWWLPLSTPHPPGSDQELMARARSDAYFAGYGFMFIGRFDQRTSYLGVRPSGGKSFDVVRAQPAGGEPRELWFDRKTGLLTRIVDGRAAQPRTVELSDYRRAGGGLLLPFMVTTYGEGRAQPVVRKLERIETLTPDRAMFSLPAAAAPARKP